MPTARPRPGSIGVRIAAHVGRAVSFAGIPFGSGNVDSSRWTYRLPGPADSQLGVEMELLERVLAAHALSVGVEIRRGQGVKGFEPSDDGVTVHADDQRVRAVPCGLRRRPQHRTQTWRLRVRGHRAGVHAG